ncbi:MAG: DUF2007 domain-containing protein [Arenimonas sp.]
MKQAYLAANSIDAQLIVDLLASAGIAAHVQGQYLSGAVGELPAGELVRVWVGDPHLAAAKALIAGAGSSELLEGALDPMLERSWRRAWSGIGAAGEGVELRDRLLQAWSEPHRRYHTMHHLHDCIALAELGLHLAEHPSEVEIALWFHDAVYELKANDNELRSALWSAQALAEAGVEVGVRERVHALVMATCHEAPAVSPDAKLLVDVDLAILGAQRERFDEYEMQVRQEYSWVPAPLFRHKRREILAGFLARPAIYATTWLRELREAQARENLSRSLARLRPWYQFW